ncbi:MAG: glycerophosphodiester phosphodiesterase [Acidimicrobiales bacterium]
MTRCGDPGGYAFLDHPGPIPFAHRGGAGEVPENTLPAFEHAVGLGYRYLETDVHATADGVLVAFHDDRLDRVTDRTGLIADLPWSTVREARVDGREPIPLLEDLLGAFPGARLNIDAKSDASVEGLVDVLRRADAVDRVCVAAFDDGRIGRLVAALPGVCESMGPRQLARLMGAAAGLPVGKFTGQCAQVPVRRGPVTIVTPRFVAAAHARGIHVHVWTIDDADEMHRLLDVGVDGIMTDRPAVLRDVLTERGEWA